MKYLRTVQLRDTDAAGVVYFANLLSICHEAYEESIRSAKIDLKTFFTNSQVIVPIIHAEIDFKRPLFCGEEIEITLKPILLTQNQFSIDYQVWQTLLTNGQEVAKAKTIHVCIEPNTRLRQCLPESLLSWIKD